MGLKIKSGDVVVIILVIALAFSLIGFYFERNNEDKTAVITQNGVVLKQVSLSNIAQTTLVPYDGLYPGVIEAENGRIRFEHAECPDQVCVHTGWISRPGQIAVCLPAGVIIKIEGSDSEQDMDILVR